MLISISILMEKTLLLEHLNDQIINIYQKYSSNTDINCFKQNKKQISSVYKTMA